MSMYQNFSQMNNPYMPIQNPYMDRMNFLQNYQHSLQQPAMLTPNSGISMTNQMSTIGKVVDSIDIVKATDIPMDGNSYYFPKADGTEVYCKQWLQNGTTRILTFKPVLDADDNNVLNADEKLKFEGFESVLTDISENVDSILEKINEITTPQKTNAKTKKELSE